MFARTRLSRCALAVASASLALAGATFAQVGTGASSLPSLPVPPENPITEEKRVLGKILFWDEQLSSSNTTACGTCHAPSAGGADLRAARHPGLDNIFNTPDDVFGSPGVVSADATDSFEKDVLFALNRQVTPRAANSMINAAYAPELFWDGRASGTFIDPQTGATVVSVGGALESQAVGPIVSDVEMAHADRDWDEVASKLRRAGPMALATELPPDVAGALASRPSYPELFAAAFGDDSITASRIGLALATYQRTLISDQSPWDRFIMGDVTAMTPQQVQGWNAFIASECDLCHVPPLFTDNAFHNIALRPNVQDIGREAVTNDPADRGKTKTASLRNLALRENLMHTGQFTQVAQVFPFYAGTGAPGNPNRDPILPSPVPPPQQPQVTDFILNALLDPRVAAEQFPFDAPTLHSELAAPNPAAIGAGRAGTGGFVPVVVLDSPPNIGNSGFRIGVDRALVGATARVAISPLAPVAGVLDTTNLSAPIVIGGSGAGQGYATFKWPIAADPSLDGQVLFMQWRIDDPGAVGGVALSNVARLTFFGGSALPHCDGDADWTYAVNFTDVSTVLANFGASGVPYRFGDTSGDGTVAFDDITAVLANLGERCD